MPAKIPSQQTTVLAVLERLSPLFHERCDEAYSGFRPREVLSSLLVHCSRLLNTAVCRLTLCKQNLRPIDPVLIGIGRIAPLPERHQYLLSDSCQQHQEAA